MSSNLYEIFFKIWQLYSNENAKKWLEISESLLYELDFSSVTDRLHLINPLSNIFQFILEEEAHSANIFERFARRRLEICAG